MKGPRRTCRAKQVGNSPETHGHRYHGMETTHLAPKVSHARELHADMATGEEGPAAERGCDAEALTDRPDRQHQLLGDGVVLC